MKKRLFIGYYNYTVWATYIGLILAVIGIYFAVRDRVEPALYCLMATGFVDMFDGKIARTKKDRTDSECRFGIQLDSLSDLVCFGVLPAVICSRIWLNGDREVIPFIPMCVIAVYVLTALIRLAYFNVTEEERQRSTTDKRKSYEGMPVTTVALIFPFAYAIGMLITLKTTGTGIIFPIIFTAVMGACAFMFIAKIRVHKPGTLGCVIMGVLGAIEVALLIYVHINVQ